MSKEDFIKCKISLIKKDNQEGFKEIVEPLQDMAENGETSRVVQVPKDGNWFKVNFNAVEVKSNRLVITAKKSVSGFRQSQFDPSIKEYAVEFFGTRAAYIYGYYKQHHPVYNWPYIYWHVRSYANHPTNSEVRVYVADFRARDELRKLITSMESIYGTKNILNSYIQDNLMRFQLGIKSRKTPEKIEKEWSRGLMESLGYNHVEVFDVGNPKGRWKSVEVHWCKDKQYLRG